jgi:hypothetical protein
MTMSAIVTVAPASQAQFRIRARGGVWLPVEDICNVSADLFAIEDINVVIFQEASSSFKLSRPSAAGAAAFSVFSLCRLPT